MAKTMWITISLALSITSLSCSESRTLAESEQKIIPYHRIGMLQVEKVFGDYVLRIFRDIEESGEGSFEIWKGSRRVYERQGFCFHLGSIYEKEKKDSLIPMGKDINGDGIPDLVVSEWTGGMHYGFIFYIFQIGNHFRLLGVIDAGHGDLSDFRNLDGDDNLEFVAADWTFAYWHTSFAESPAPRIILRYQNGAYRLARDLMRKAPMKQSELEAQAADIRSLGRESRFLPTVDLWKIMLDLIYSGNANQAWHYYEKAWPADLNGKNEFLMEFRQKLETSLYWSEIKSMNEGR